MSDYYAATKDIASLYFKTGLNPQHYGAFIVGYLNPDDSVVYRNPSFSTLDYGAYELGKLALLAAREEEDNLYKQVSSGLYNLAKRLDNKE